MYTEHQFIGTASKEEVLQANDKLRKNTEPGTDMIIPAESLTVHEEEPKKKLQKLINAIWETEK
jgi:transcriptional/translational regulatory protein YebC/TACO1